MCICWHYYCIYTTLLPKEFSFIGFLNLGLQQLCCSRKLWHNSLYLSAAVSSADSTSPPTCSFLITWHSSKVCSQPSENMPFSFTCISSLKDLAFLFIVIPVTGFPLERIAVNHLCNILSSCANLGCFNACCFRRYCTLLLDTIKDHNWSFCFFTS